MKKQLKIIFMGTPEFAIPTLESLKQAGHTIVAVYCQPERKKGRGGKIQKNPTHIWADLHNISVLTPLNFRNKDDVETFKNFKADIAVVVAYGILLPKSILDIPPLGCVNIHGSLLPKWRGAAPIQRAIMENDAVTGITTMLMDEGLDTGDMLESEEILISPDATSQTLYDELSIIGSKLIISTINGLSAQTLRRVPQTEENVSYAQKLEKSEGYLEFSRSAIALYAIIRGLFPQISVWYDLGEIRLKLLKVIPEKGTLNLLPGSWKRIDNKLYIQCGEGVLRIITLQPEGSKPMDVDAFLRGYKI